MPIPVCAPLVGTRERDLVLECVEGGWISSEGPMVARFEQAVARDCARRHAVAVCNGTAALEVAFDALDLPAGSEVIMPSFTIISCATAVVTRGLVPVFVDCRPDVFTLDPAAVEAAIGPRTRAILAVHIYGHPAQMDEIAELAVTHGLATVEDAAEAHGALYKGRPAGSFGDLSCFSYYANKIVTTGEGGMVLTDDEGLAARCRSLRNLCFGTGPNRFEHTAIGHNYRLTAVQAALGVGQQERLAQSVETKRRHAARYRAHTADLAFVEWPPEHAWARAVYWMHALTLADDFPRDAAWMRDRLAERGIGTRPFFWGLHEQPAIRARGFAGADRRLPVTERIARRGLYLPSGLGLADDDIDTVCDALRAIAADA